MGAGNRQRMMGCENDRPPGSHSLGQQTLKPLHAVAVDGSEGFVEDPQGFVGDIQPGQGHTPLLSGGKVMAGHMAEGKQRDGVQCLLQLVLGYRGIARQHPPQVFHGSQQWFDAGTMADVKKIPPKMLPHLAHGLTAPGDLAVEPSVKPGQYSQQCGLARAVGALYPQQRARGHGQVQAGEQHTLITLARQAASL